MIISGQTIHSLCFPFEDDSDKLLPLIAPCVRRTRHRGVTYGLGPAGYDVRVEFDSEGILPYKTLDPGEFILASTIEAFCMPRDLIGIVHDKSTWARRGIAVQNTVIEPGWRGFLTLELTNHSDEKVTIYKGVGIAQILFHRLDQPVDQQYEGKYQDQKRGPVKPILENF